MLQEENIGKYLHDFGAGKIFFKKVQKTKTKQNKKVQKTLILKEKMDTLDFRKIRNFIKRHH